MTAQPQVPAALGVDASGRRGLHEAPPWRPAYGFWKTLALSAQLAMQGFQLQEAQDHQDRRFFSWQPDAAAGSAEEQRLLIGIQMRLAQLAVARLCSAQVVCVSPKALNDVVFFADHEPAQRWALGAKPAYDPVYLDFATTRQTAAMRVDGSDPWAFAGALVFRDEGLLTVMPFAAPSGEHGPAFQPVGRVRLADGPLTGKPEPGDVLLDGYSGNAAAMLCADPQSRINQRARGAVALTTGALSVLRHLGLADVELVPELRDPKARAKVLASGERVALAPRRRRR